MKVLCTFPPMYAEINRRFNVRGRPVIFTWGDTIHNPSRIKITPELMVHEGVHSNRQGEEPEFWWIEYIANPEFRLAEEIPAHRAEYADVFSRVPTGRVTETALHRIAARLSSPLYGSMIDYYEARRLIEYGAREEQDTTPRRGNVGP
jgi:hypothetical protein